MEYDLNRNFRWLKSDVIATVFLFFLFPVACYFFFYLLGTNWNVAVRSGVGLGFLAAFIFYLLRAPWGTDYPIENMQYTLQVLDEHGRCNSYIDCRWPRNKQVRFHRRCFPYTLDERGKVKHLDEYQMKKVPRRRIQWDHYAGLDLYFRKKDWIQFQDRSFINNLKSMYVFNHDTDLIGEHYWVRFMTDNSTLLKILRHVSGSDKIPMIQAITRLPLEQVFASTNEKGDRTDSLPDMRQCKIFWEERREEEKQKAKLERLREEQRIIDQNRREAEQQYRKKRRR
jgi:hypothetical protein